MAEPLISALFSTYNRRDLLRLVLQSLQRQTLPRERFEVIVVDDGSTDDTPALETEFSASLNLIWTRQEHLGLAAGKNRALALVRSPIALFMDDDDVASPNLLEEHLAAHRRHPAVNIAVLGFTELSPEVRARPLMHFVTEVGCQLFAYPRLSEGSMLDYTHFWGGRSSCKMALLDGVDGPFDTDFRFGCEDVELGYRLRGRGLQVVLHRPALTTMIRAMTLDDFFGRIRRQGESNWRFHEKHPSREVLHWTELVGLEDEWRRVSNRFDDVVAATRGLDRLVEARVRHGVEVDQSVLRLLHDHYWASFQSYRLLGSWTARERSFGREPDMPPQVSSQRVRRAAPNRVVYMKRKARAPDFLVIGAQKAGTTWLHQNLCQHDQVWLPPVKELHYLNQKFMPSERGWEWEYRCRTAEEFRQYLRASPEPRDARRREKRRSRAAALELCAQHELDERSYLEIFGNADPSMVCGEVTPDYSMVPLDAVRHISQLNPRLRAILIMRDPVARAASHLRMLCSAGEIPQPSQDVDSVSIDGVVARSDYGPMIERWQGSLKSGSLYLAAYEDIADDPTQFLAGICKLLGIRADKSVFPDRERVVFPGPRYELHERVIRTLEERLAHVYADVARVAPSIAARWKSRSR